MRECARLYEAAGQLEAAAAAFERGCAWLGELGVEDPELAEDLVTLLQLRASFLLQHAWVEAAAEPLEQALELTDGWMETGRTSPRRLHLHALVLYLLAEQAVARGRAREAAQFLSRAVAALELVVEHQPQWRGQLSQWRAELRAYPEQ